MLHKEFGLISIIMAAYNAEKTIEQAINSALRQTYTDFELLVVNDCSKDRTVELVKSIAAKDNRVRLISNEKNSGVFKEDDIENAVSAVIECINNRTHCIEQGKKFAEESSTRTYKKKMELSFMEAGE